MLTWTLVLTLKRVHPNLKSKQIYNSASIFSVCRGFIKFLCRWSVGFFSRAFLVFLMKESKKRRWKQLGKLMVKSRSEPVNLPSARPLMNPLTICLILTCLLIKKNLFFECAFAHPIMLFLSYLVKNSMDCLSLICKLAMKWYLMCMCTSWLCPFNPSHYQGSYNVGR